ncbi:deoxyribose-phosphate aldolase [Shinella zoogloeoides]|uniref:Deoxyribose-phosphate aldolase n=2 Tax=Shinella zoogloeoides TaxID=352475 RepID=A0A6N8TLF9_SHIZO|nr:deoxyribose-phosphate aldolase [Shinella zoogloeoides]MXO01980.1 deoxyribose-phosphate aldolase [Shinella zoogloeoides]UEX81613.1 deoxyribose-phosphate aldolase [Shinella zoogloeoides]
MTMLEETAKKTLSLLDLTDLTDTCDAAAIEKLCQQAQTPFGTTAAICIWPRFVAQARGILGAGHAVKIATVVNFPSGDLAVADVVAETQRAIADGADEIDLVIPYRAFLAGNEAAVTEMVTAVKAACTPPVILKTILETGEIEDVALIRRASDLAIAAGSDFIKTSTGKVAVNATLDAAGIMLTAIRESGKPVGFKPAGGVRTVGDARDYLALAASILGEGWATPKTFRFGASGLLGDILSVLGGQPAPSAPASY